MSARRERIPQPIPLTQLTAVTPELDSGELDAVTTRILEGLQPFDDAHTANEIVQLRQQHATIVVQIGRRLEQARVHYLAAGARNDLSESAAGFKAFCESCHIGFRTAYNYIAVVRRLAEANLLTETPNILGLNAGVTKLLAITEFDPEDLRALEDGVTIEGIGDLDAVDRMRVSELRTAIRKKEEQLRQTQELLTSSEGEKSDALAARDEYKRRSEAKGRHQVSDIGRDFLQAVYAPCRSWANDHAFKSKEERIEAAKDVMKFHADMAEIIHRTLLRESTGEHPMQDLRVEDLLDDEDAS